MRRVMEGRNFIKAQIISSDSIPMQKIGEDLFNAAILEQSSANVWEEVTTSSLFNFKWKPTSRGINYQLLSKFGIKQLVNHIEGHESLTTKNELYLNMRAHCEKTQKNVFSMLPLTFTLDC